MANTHPNAVIIPDPVCLNDFALQQNSRYKLECILDQSMLFPGNGVCGIILYGLYGTGKTTMAKLLPGLIDTSKSDPIHGNIPPSEIIDTQNPYDDYYACAQGQNGAQITQQILNRTQLMNMNPSGLHFVILDEVDNLTPAAQAGFKAVMNRTQVVFIMTTNSLETIEPGIQNRSVLIDMNVPPVEHWRPILRRVYTASNLTAPADAVLDQVVLAGRGSARSIFTDVIIGVNQAKRQSKSSISKISNLRS